MAVIALLSRLAAVVDVRDLADLVIAAALAGRRAESAISMPGRRLGTPRAYMPLYPAIPDAPDLSGVDRN